MTTKFEYQLKNTLAVPNLWKIFSSHSQNHSKLRRYMWILVFGTCAALFLYETTDRLGQLFHPQKSASINLSYQKLLKFPAVTVCPGYQFRKSVMTKLGLDEYGCKPGQRVCTWDFPWNMATHTEGIIKSCRYKNRWNCIPGTEEKGKWTRFTTSIGRCFTYLVEEPIYIGGDSNGLELSLDPMLWDKLGQSKFKGVRVYIHSPTEKPLASISGIYLASGSAVHFALLIKDFNRVNDVKHSPCRSKSAYSQNKCVINCIQSEAVTKSNTSCGAPFMKEFNIKVCRNEKDIKLFMQTFDNLVLNGSTWKRCMNKCPITCKQRIYTPITSSLGYSRASDNNSLINVTIFYKDMWLEHIVEHWDYNIEEFVSDTGGSLNLFLGASFYSFIQVCDYFLAVFIGKLHKIYKKINLPKYITKEKNKVDSSLKLFW